MNNIETTLSSCEDPCLVLGVSPNASEEETRAAYLRKIKEFPPDRSPEKFERIRDAYQILNDPQHRAHLVLEADPRAPLSTLLDNQKDKKEFLGPSPWIDILKKTKLKAKNK